jgi:RNA polymerase sigma factor (sigma-70 family)
MTSKEQSNSLSDEQLWLQLQAGSEFALSRLLKKYFNLLQNYAHKFSRDEDFIKDCVQEVFIEIWQKRDRISTPDSVKAYLLGSVRRKVFRETSRQRIRRDDSDDFDNDLHFPLNPSVETSIIEQESIDALEKKMKLLLEQLPSRQSEVLYLLYYQNLSRAEVAEIMNINTQSVSNLIQRAFKTIRDHWPSGIISLGFVLLLSKLILSKLGI